MSHSIVSATAPDNKVDLLKQELQILAEIDRELMNNKTDTRTASVDLIEWKKRVAEILGSDEIYTIEADDSR